MPLVAEPVTRPEHVRAGQPAPHRSGNGRASSTGSAFFAAGWKRLYEDVAFGNYLEARQRMDGAVWEESYRRYWKDLERYAMKRLRAAAARLDARLVFGSWNRVSLKTLNSVLNEPGVA